LVESVDYCGNSGKIEGIGFELFGLVLGFGDDGID
jgi:hypothetical protein